VDIGNRYLWRLGCFVGMERLMNDKPTKAGEYIPPAFPSTFHNGWGEPEKGMALRDYFAAKAMQNFRDQIGSQSDQEWFDKVAKGAYRMADAMLKAREA
jgi:hypothetical protein